jgi:HK97 family phage major capsid protein
VAEDTGLSFTDPTFAKVQMTPKHAGCLTEFSRNMLLQPSKDIESLIREDFAAVLARAVDSVAINGGGANEPDGILQTSGLDTTVSDADTWAEILSLIEICELENAEGGAFLTDPSVVRLYRSIAKVSSTDSVMIMQSPTELAGYPLASTNLVPFASSSTHKLIFGNFADVLLGYWSELDILVNPYESSAYAKGNVQVRGMLTCDVAIRHIESFAASINITV